MWIILKFQSKIPICQIHSVPSGLAAPQIHMQMHITPFLSVSRLALDLGPRLVKSRQKRPFSQTRRMKEARRLWSMQRMFMHDKIPWYSSPWSMRRMRQRLPFTLLTLSNVLCFTSGNGLMEWRYGAWAYGANTYTSLLFTLKSQTWFDLHLTKQGTNLIDLRRGL